MIDPLEIALRLLAAAVLGGVIGFNRGQLAWTAGLRTHMLVAVGAALTVIVSAYGFNDVLAHPHVILDPSRIAAQVISGIGFLGAGTILFMPRERVVRGLTTAAGLWAVAAVGLAAGSGLFIAATMATVLMWLILAALKPFEQRFIAHHGNLLPRLQVRLVPGTTLGTLEATIREHHLPLFKMSVRREEHAEDSVLIQFTGSVRRRQLVTLADAIRHIEGIKSVALEADTK